MTMSGRFVDRGVRILVAAALLLAVMSSPMRPTRASRNAPPPGYLRRNFAIFEVWQIGQLAMSALPALREEASFDSGTEEERDADIEDELSGSSPPAPVPFEVIPTPCPEPRSQVAGFAVALAARPLRC